MRCETIFLHTDMWQNCDNDEPLKENHSRHVFYVPAALHPSTGEFLNPGLCLHDLKVQWNERLRRFYLKEDEFLEQYNTFLQDLADKRICYVRRWLSINTSRFGNRIEAAGLFHRLEKLAKELKAAVTLCGTTCSSCGLLCLEQKYHTKKHDCVTYHKCHGPCEFREQHTEMLTPECKLS
jgi:hypothetical protein